MDIGMLWFDKDQSTSFPAKVKRVSEYYQKKYGKDPNVCFVHPATVGDGLGRGVGGAGDIKVEDVRVQITERVLPHHFWIGVSNGNT